MWVCTLRHIIYHLDISEVGFNISVVELEINIDDVRIEYWTVVIVVMRNCFVQCFQP